MSKTRQLGAIMFADIMGFTALMEENEKNASEWRARLRQSLSVLIPEHNGRIIELMGDGALCFFQSAYEAVKASIALQYEMKKDTPIPLRIGIHTGEVVIEDNSVYGSVVNLASRVESFSVPGGIFVSDKVNDELKNKTDISTISLGKFQFKNVDTPLEIFAISNEGIIVPARQKLSGKGTAVADKKVTLSKNMLIGIAAALLIALGGFFILNKKSENKSKAIESIAVIPFENQDKDAKSDYFADGITEDINTNLARISSLTVISHTTMQLFKNTLKSNKEIGKELNVKSVLKGNLRRNGEKIRIHAELIDVNTQKNLWSETFEEDYSKIFELQSEIARQIADKLSVKVSADEKQRIEQKPTDNLQAYDYYLKGRDYYYKYKNEDNEQAINYFKKAIALDNNYALAWAGLGDAYSQKHSIFGAEAAWLDSSKIAGQRAIQLDSNSSEAYKALSNAYYYAKEYDKGFELLQKSVALNPNNAQAVGNLGTAYFLKAQLDEALKWEKKAAAINPKNGIPYMVIGWAYRLLGDYTRAEQWLKKSLELRKFLETYRQLAYTFLLQQKKDSAGAIVPLIIAIDSNNNRNYEAAGMITHIMGDTLTARKYFEKAISLNKSISTDIEGYEAVSLGQLLLNEGNTIEADIHLTTALSAYKKAIEEGSQDDDHALFIAAVYAIKSDKQQALTWLKKAQEFKWLDYGFGELTPWFKNIRNEPAFKQAMTILRQKTADLRKKAESL
jgi:TolB-like protein/class 3 adenylate cyclase